MTDNNLTKYCNFSKIRRQGPSSFRVMWVGSPVGGPE